MIGRFLITLIVAFLYCVSSDAQKIQGVVTDNGQKTLQGATIGLCKASDSSLVKFTASDANGKYIFSGIQPGRYLIKVTNVNYKDTYSSGFEYDGKNDVSVVSLSLITLPKELSQVVVTSKKPPIEVKADKTIVNVEGTINAIGNDVLELLKKSPGVQVDKDENLSMSGKNGVQAYIDGRPTPLSGKDLADYLKSIQSSQVEAIELITNPSARYDAAGNAGIINIRLKKNKAFGTNGSINAGYNIGIFSKYNGGLSLNHRNKKINVFGNYNFTGGKFEQEINIDRTILDTFFAQRNRIHFLPSFNNFKTGFDFFINKKSTFGIILSGVLANGDVESNSRTPIVYKPTSVTNKILVAATNAEFKRNNINTNLNYRYTDTAGRELNIDADYGHYKIRNIQYQPNYYYDGAGTTQTSSVIYRMIAPNDIYIYTLKSDFSLPFKKGQLSLGGKTAFIDSRNDFKRYNVIGSGDKLDTLKSNNFNYKENINAIYLNFNKTFKNLVIQFGVRMENTNTEGISKGFKSSGTNGYVVYDSTFTRHYTDFFPSAAVTFTKNPKSQWGLSYSRRIDRPTYQSLNPFEFRLDEYTSQRGNTALTPQYTNSFSITHTYNYKLNTRLSYSHTKDIFSQITDTSDKSRIFLTQRNLATQDAASINISYPLQIKWYSSFISFSSFYSHYKANFGAGRLINLDVFSVTLFVQNSFKFGKGWTGELSGNYNSPSIFQGTFKVKTTYGIDLGLQKLVLKDKGTVKISVTDITEGRQVTATSDFAGQQVETDFISETRQFKINFSYRFGSNQVKAARQRRTGAEDELNRVQTTN